MMPSVRSPIHLNWAGRLFPTPTEPRLYSGVTPASRSKTAAHIIADHAELGLRNAENLAGNLLPGCRGRTGPWPAACSDPRMYRTRRYSHDFPSDCRRPRLTQTRCLMTWAAFRQRRVDGCGIAFFKRIGFVARISRPIERRHSAPAHHRPI